LLDAHGAGSMGALSTTDQTFQQAVQDLLGCGEILVVIRYVYGGGSREFRFFRDISKFRSTLARLRRRDSVVVMKSFREVIEGTVDAPFIDAAANRYQEGEYWILLDDDAPKYVGKEYYVSSRAELVADLKAMLGHRVRLIEQPDYTSEEQSIGAYVPDPDGVVRPGAY
jgi:hypothetical protein